MTSWPVAFIGFIVTFVTGPSHQFPFSSAAGPTPGHAFLPAWRPRSPPRLGVHESGHAGLARPMTAAAIGRAEILSRQVCLQQRAGACPHDVRARAGPEPLALKPWCSYTFTVGEGRGRLKEAAGPLAPGQGGGEILDRATRRTQKPWPQRVSFQEG